VWRRRRYRVDKSLEGFLVHVCFLEQRRDYELMLDLLSRFLTKSSSFNVGRGMADVRPALRFVAAMVYIRVVWKKIVI
jgi:hypothetical protein